AAAALVLAAIGLLFTKSLHGTAQSGVTTEKATVHPARQVTRHRDHRAPGPSFVAYRDQEYGYTLSLPSGFSPWRILELPSGMGDVRRAAYEDLEVSTFGDQFIACFANLSTANLNGTSLSWIKEIR